MQPLATTLNREWTPTRDYTAGFELNMKMSALYVIGSVGSNTAFQ